MIAYLLVQLFFITSCQRFLLIICCDHLNVKNYFIIIILIESKLLDDYLIIT